MGEFVLVLGCGALAVAMAWLSDRRKLRKFIVAFRKAQEAFTTPWHYRVATADDAFLFVRIPKSTVLETTNRMTFLGDAVLEVGEHREGCRVFVDGDRTSLLVLQSTSTTAESYTAELFLETKVGKPVPFTLPPFRLPHSVEADASLSHLLAAHREFIRGATQDPLLQFDTLPDAIRTWERISARTAAWRGAQDPEELLHQDLRMLAGEHYPVFWERLGPQLRAEIPRARVRSRPG